MATVTLADAKARLSALVERAARGKPVTITRHGRPIAQITKLETARRPIDPAALREITDAIPRQEASARDWMREMRDIAGY